MPSPVTNYSDNFKIIHTTIKYCFMKLTCPKYLSSVLQAENYILAYIYKMQLDWSLKTLKKVFFVLFTLYFVSCKLTIHRFQPLVYFRKVPTLLEVGFVNKVDIMQCSKFTGSQPKIISIQQTQTQLSFQLKQNKFLYIIDFHKVDI